MNGEALIFLSGLSQALAYGGFNLWKMYRRYKHKNEVFCIVSSRHTGISTCVKALRDDNRENRRAIIVDENDVLDKQPKPLMEHLMEIRDTNQDSYMIEVYPLIRQHIQDLRSIHGNKPIVLFTSLNSLPKFLGIKDKRVLLLYTSTEFHNELQSGLLSEGLCKEDVKRMSDTRDMLLSLPYERMKYNSFGNLRRILEQMLYGRHF